MRQPKASAVDEGGVVMGLEPGSPLPVEGPRPALLTTGDMARRSSTTVRTVRFYEEVGVLEPAERTEGGHRLFPASELDKLVCVTAMRDAGLSLDEIRSLLGAKAAQGCGAEAARQVSETLGRHIAAMTEKIAALERLRGEFERAAGALEGCRGCHDVERFPRACGDCEAMPRPAPSRALRVLWQIAPDEAAGVDEP